MRFVAAGRKIEETHRLRRWNRRWHEIPMVHSWWPFYRGNERDFAQKWRLHHRNLAMSCHVGSRGSRGSRGNCGFPILREADHSGQFGFDLSTPMVSHGFPWFQVCTSRWCSSNPVFWFLSGLLVLRRLEFGASTSRYRVFVIVAISLFDR